MAIARQRRATTADAGTVSRSETQTGQADSGLARHAAGHRKVNAEVEDSRRAALNLMEDAIQSRRAAETLVAALRESEERLAKELTAARQLQSVSALPIEGSDIQSFYQKIVDAAVVIMRSDCASMQVLDEGE